MHQNLEESKMTTGANYGGVWPESGRKLADGARGERGKGFIQG